MVVSLSLYVPLAVLAVVASVTATLSVVRRLAAPTAKPLLGVCVLLLTAVVAQAVVLVPSPLRQALRAVLGIALPGDYWLVVVFGLTLPACGLWLLFAIQHTGRGDRLRRQVALLMTFLIGLCYAAVVWITLSDIGSAGASTPSGILASGLFFISPFASLGALLIVEAALRRNALPFGEAALLASGSLLFIYGPIVAFNLQQPLFVPASLCGATGLFTVAVRQYPVFETLPVARITARDRLVEEIDDAVALVDEQARVVDLNAAAESLFDVDATSVDRRRLDDVAPVLPGLSELTTASEPTAVQQGQASLEVLASHVRDERGIPVGYLVVCRDVTERQRRERRLRLLTRFLTETVGERTATVAGQASRLTGPDERADESQSGSQAESPPGIPTAIRQTTDSLARLVAATRRVERALSDRGTGTCDLGAVLQTSVADRDAVSLHVDEEFDSDTAPTVAADSSVVRAVVDLLLEEQLARHPSGLEVRLSTSTTADSVTELRPAASQSTGDRASTHRPAGHGPQYGPEASTPETVDDPTIELSRLALEHAGGSVERRDGDAVQVAFEHLSSRTADPTGRRDGTQPSGETPATDTSEGGGSER